MMENLTVVEDNHTVISSRSTDSTDDHVAGAEVARGAVNQAEPFLTGQLGIEVEIVLPPVVRARIVGQLDPEVVGIELAQKAVAVLLLDVEVETF